MARTSEKKKESEKERNEREIKKYRKRSFYVLGIRAWQSFWKLLGENGREKKKSEEERGRVRKRVGEKERKKERAISCSWNPKLVKFLETVGREWERERKNRKKREEE